MSTIGFLACETTLPSLGERRRGDAYEHDLMIAALQPACERHGLKLCVIDWEAPISAFGEVSLVILGSTWNYQDKPAAFLEKLETLTHNGITVCNSPEIVRWNCQKTYLRELAERGASIVPTLWQQKVERAELDEAFDHFDCEQLVVKRQIGAGAFDQILIARDNLPDTTWSYEHPAMLQPFLPAIMDDGELSFVFIDGALSHALRKQPAKGDYRIQSLYGGTESVFDPEPDDIHAAEAIIDALPFADPLYARVDMLRADNGSLMVMEAELIEPYLYPEQGPELGELLARAIAKRL